MSTTTQTYLLTLYVTYQQETAIRDLFTSNGWTYKKKGEDKDNGSFAEQEEGHVRPSLAWESDSDNGASSEADIEEKAEDLINDDAESIKGAGNTVKAVSANADEIETEKPENGDLDFVKVKTELVAVSDHDDGDDEDDMTPDVEYDDDDTEEDSDEYLPDSDTRRSGRKRKMATPKTRSKKTKSEKKGKKGVAVKTKLKTYGDKTATSRPKIEKGSTSSSKSAKTVKLDDSTDKNELNNIDADLDVVPERLAVELELQESDDIDHYETVLKSLSPDEPFSPPTDVQESDGFSESLGCYYCHDCGYTFQLQRWYDTHKWKGRCVYPCPVCFEQFTFRNISVYRTHITTHKLELEAEDKSDHHLKPHVSSTVTRDLDKVLYRCTIAECEKVFSSKSGLLRHVKGHNKELFKCTRCSSFYSTREKFEEHNKLKHCRSLHKCKTCDSGFHTAGSLKCHIRACHTNTPHPFPCVNCHKSFTTLKRLAEHANFHLGAKPHSCKFCQQPYYRHDSCRRHEKICLTRKNKKRSLEIELALCDLTNIKCTFAGCDKKFSTKFNLYRHIRSHNQKLFKCSKCTQYFESAEDFKEHNELKHSQAIVCHQCGKTVASSSNLKRHAKLCVAGEKVQCELCPKVFSSRQGMLEHRNLHLGATPYSCKHCQRNYSRYDSCKRHEKNCQSGGVLCRFCGCTFSCKTSMVDHIVAVHENQRFKCDACGVTFKYRSSLHKHKKRKGH